MGGMSAGRREPRPRTTGPEQSAAHDTHTRGELTDQSSVWMALKQNASSQHVMNKLSVFTYKKESIEED